MPPPEEIAAWQPWNQATDEELFLALIDRFGINPQRDDNPAVYPDQHVWILSKDTIEKTGYGIGDQRNQGTVEGYTNFHSRWRFNSDGKFATVGHWE